MKSFVLKKWYFDLVAESGDVLYAYFIITRIFGWQRGFVSAHLNLADGRVLRCTMTTSPPPPSSGRDLAFGRQILSSPELRPKLVMEFKNLALELEYDPLEQGWDPTPDAVLLKQGRRILKWRVPVPAARVKGWIRADGRLIEIVGNGYHDYVETDIPPWRLPIRELFWGRAWVDGQTVVFNQITTRQGALLQNFLLSGRSAAAGKAPISIGRRDDDQRFEIEAQDEDATTRIAKGVWSLRLERRAIIEESPVTTGDRIRSRLLRRISARMCGDPCEKKMFSEARLTDGAISLRGQAVHERVSWRWNSPAPWVTVGVYTLIFWFLIPGFLAAVGHRLDELVRISLPKQGWSRWSGFVLAVAGLALTAVSIGQLWFQGKGLPISALPPRRFVASGAYRFFRHPLYLGFNAAFAGWALLRGSFGSLAFGAPLLLVGWIAYALFAEEPALEARFGESYRAYRAATPLLVPRRVGRLIARAFRPFGEGVCHLLTALAGRPILYRRGNLILVTYGLFVSAGVLLFTQHTTALLIAQGLTKSQAAALHISNVLAAPLVGYLFWWLGHWRKLIRQPRFGLRNIGFVSYGALTGLFLSSSIFGLIHGYPPSLITDAMVRGMFLAYAFGRIGCVTYGCCWGIAAARTGIRYRNPQSKVLRLTGRAEALCRPAQAYSMLEGLALFLVLNLLVLHPLPAGLLTALAFLVYPVGRFFIEFSRERSRFLYGRFHEGHLGCAAMFAAGLVLLFILPASAVPSPRPWTPAAFIQSLPLLPVSILVGAFVFFVAGVHWKKVGTW